MDQVVSLVALGVGLLLGFLGALWMGRKAQVQALERGRAEGALELARLQERALGDQEEFRRLNGQTAELERQRRELDAQLRQESALRAGAQADAAQLREALSRLDREREAARAEAEDLQRSLRALQGEASQVQGVAQQQRELLDRQEVRLRALEEASRSLQEAKAQLEASLAETLKELELERRQGDEKLALLNGSQEELSNRFKLLADTLLEEKSQRFTEQNRTNLDQVLGPLKERIQEFQKKVEDVYDKEGRDRTALAEQVRQLMELNRQVSTDAQSLASALKSSTKVQGNWGELVLERVLQASGLVRDQHYLVQPTYTRPDRTQCRPDVVLRLPDDRHLVVDSKVTLQSYQEYVEAPEGSEREAAVVRLAASMRSHMKGLSAREYQDLEQLQSADFVVMFVPIEPALLLALAKDEKLWEDAWRQNVLMVSPSSLLFVVRMVAMLWRGEAQRQNLQAIVDRGRTLYDKFVAFTEDLRKVGNQLASAQKSHEDAMRKLSEGTGNLVRQAEMLRELGVKPSKTLDPRLTRAVSGEEEALATLEG